MHSLKKHSTLEGGPQNSLEVPSLAALRVEERVQGMPEGDPRVWCIALLLVIILILYTLLGT